MNALELTKPANFLYLFPLYLPLSLSLSLSHSLSLSLSLRVNPLELTKATKEETRRSSALPDTKSFFIEAKFDGLLRSLIKKKLVISFLFLFFQHSLYQIKSHKEGEGW